MSKRNFEGLLMREDLPHNADAERAILGGILLDNAAYQQASALSAGDFFLDAHGKLFAVIGGLYGKGAPVDMVTLKEDLSRRGELDAIGGARLRPSHRCLLVAPVGCWI
ncbi:MAG: hypothetical protein HY313_04140 [Acidobacteria bacterium]|nr:hypothetical protein [Acidobacteriota bacterium]